MMAVKPTLQPPSSPQAVLPRGFADGYGPGSSRYDEMLDRDGSLRPQWKMFVSMLDDLGKDELSRRWDQARRLIHENGITHNVYGDANGLERPWNLDFIPLLLPMEQWKDLSGALVQRARLLDVLLADLYGPGRCVSAGCLPPELLYGNPSFLRACHGFIPQRGGRLHLYAADIARCNDGQFQVLSDRTQAPSGAGYTLENRIVLAQALPAIFRQCNVERLAPFFVALRQTLSDLTPGNRENPRVVLLTPGPYNETYFEHAYLARYLGYTLVQGNDLTVRDAKVFLKTLSGLQRVDVILRRVDDSYCDPLELYAHSFLGVPGLLEAVREGNVAIANTLGSGVLQAPAFLPFLPGLCRYFFGEDLKLPSVQTWWCGQPKALRHVLEHLHELVIKPAFPGAEGDPIFGHLLSLEERSELQARISADPIRFVGQEHVVSCTVPVMQGDEAQSRRFVVRAYLAASQGSFTVMPGGLTRITSSAESLTVSLQKGGGSKDTWILADGPVSQVTLLAPSSIELTRGGGDLPSRVADDLFWLGRYVQRTESLVRLTRGVLGRLTVPTGLESERTLRLLLNALLGKNTLKLGPRTEHELVEAVFAPYRPEGLRAAVGHVHGLARVLRDRISADAWRILQTIERDVAAFSGDVDDDHVPGVIELLDKLVVSFAAFIGLAMDSMTRGQSWRFLDLGHRIERAVGLSRLLRSTLIDAAKEDSSVLEAVLEVADSSLTYRRRYVTHFEVAAVVDLLVADETNPRAVAFQIAAVEEHLANLPRESTHPRRSPDRQRAARLRANVRLVDLAIDCKAVDDKRPALAALLTGVIDDLNMISELLSQTYFSHATARRVITGGEEAS